MAKRARQSSRRVRKAATSETLHAPRSPDGALVTIRAARQEYDTPIELVVTRDASPAIERMAREWGYILRVRTRWNGDADLRRDFGERAVGDLEKLGIDRNFIQGIVPAGHVEVELHAWDPADAEANRIYEAASEVPWEYLLSSATRSEGRFGSQLITRLFDNGAPAVVPSPPDRVLFVESAPGRLKEVYEFDDEEERIRAAVNATDTRDIMTIVKTLSVTQLAQKVYSEKEKWDAIHVTGVDTHQAAWKIEDFYSPDRLKIWKNITDETGRLLDGMILREEHENEFPVRYDKLAELLVDPKKPPRVISLNLYYSGARTARELVRRGAHAALGFLDEIDDESAELFFQTFYWKWCRPEEGEPTLAIPEAFLQAWLEARSDRLHGTAITIWLGRSVFKQAPPQPRSASRSAAGKRRVKT
jgi:hypothetical protein